MQKGVVHIDRNVLLYELAVGLRPLLTCLSFNSAIDRGHVCQELRMRAINCSLSRNEQASLIINSATVISERRRAIDQFLVKGLLRSRT